MTDSPGARLKKIRLQKGLTLEQVHKATKIHTHILEALEGDGITNISPVYLRSFLKIYSTYLGQDPKDFVNLIKESRQTPRVSTEKPEQPPVTPPSPPQVKKPVRERAHARQQISRAAVAQGAQIFKAAGSRLKRVRISPQVRTGIALVAVILILLAGLIKLGQLTTRKIRGVIARRQAAVETEVARETPPPSERGVVEAAVPSTSPQAEVAAQPPAADRPAPAAQTDEIKLVIRAKQNCWVFLKADGKVVFQRILEKGRFETWFANDKMELSLGNAGGVEIEVNGQMFKNLGRRRQTLKNIVITKEGLQVDR